MYTYEIERELDMKYYEELLVIINRYNKYVKNPKTKVSSPLLTCIYLCTMIVIVMIGCIFVLYEPQFAIFRAVVTTIYALSILYIVIFTSRFYLSLNKFRKNRGKRFFCMDEKKLLLKEDDKEISMEFSRLAAVMLNKHSICFLPTDCKGVVFGLPISCKDEVVDYLVKIGKDNLIVRK